MPLRADAQDHQSLGSAVERQIEPWTLNAVTKGGERDRLHTQTATQLGRAPAHAHEGFVQALALGQAGHLRVLLRDLAGVDRRHGQLAGGAAVHAEHDHLEVALRAPHDGPEAAAFGRQHGRVSVHEHANGAVRRHGAFDQQPLAGPLHGGHVEAFEQLARDQGGGDTRSSLRSARARPVTPARLRDLRVGTGARETHGQHHGADAQQDRGAEQQQTLLAAEADLPKRDYVPGQPGGAELARGHLVMAVLVLPAARTAPQTLVVLSETSRALDHSLRLRRAGRNGSVLGPTGSPSAIPGLGVYPGAARLAAVLALVALAVLVGLPSRRGLGLPLAPRGGLPTALRPGPTTLGSA